MPKKSVIGLLAILVALVIFAETNRTRFHTDTYMLCLGVAGDGPVVTAEEMTMCACMADRTIETLPLKSRLPRGMIALSEDDNKALIAAKSVCPGASD